MLLLPILTTEEQRVVLQSRILHPAQTAGAGKTVAYIPIKLWVSNEALSFYSRAGRTTMRDITTVVSICLWRGSIYNLQAIPTEKSAGVVDARFCSALSASQDWMAKTTATLCHCETRFPTEV